MIIGIELNLIVSVIHDAIDASVTKSAHSQLRLQRCMRFGTAAPLQDAFRSWWSFTESETGPASPELRA